MASKAKDKMIQDQLTFEFFSTSAENEEVVKQKAAQSKEKPAKNVAKTEPAKKLVKLAKNTKNIKHNHFKKFRKVRRLPSRVI